MGELLRVEKWAENLEEVTLGRWLKAEGDPVAAGEALCEMITEKVTFEYEAPVSGVLGKIYAPEKSVLPVGFVFAFLGEVGEVPPPEIETENQRLLDAYADQARVALDLDKVRQEKAAAGTVTVQGGGQGAGGRVRAVPAARRAAREHGISLSEVAEWLRADRPLLPEDVERYVAERRQLRHD